MAPSSSETPHYEGFLRIGWKQMHTEPFLKVRTTVPDLVQSLEIYHSHACTGRGWQRNVE